MKNEKRPQVPSWLTSIQERSWEPEILISGIALLALTQMPRLLDQLQIFLEERSLQLFFFGDLDAVAVSLLKASTYWLIIGLIVHLLLRSVWVSFIGLSYTFPSGLQPERLRFQPFFQKRIARLPSFEDSIQRLEAMCSTVYAIAFLFMMATISTFFYLVFIALSVQIAFMIYPGLINFGPMVDNVITVFTAIFALPYLVDFLTLGWLKRLRGFWIVYRPIYRFMGFITLAGVYRGIYYGLVSNLNRYALFGGMLAFLAFSYFVGIKGGSNPLDRTSMFHSNIGTSTFDGYYRDSGAARSSIWAHIQSSKIEQGLIELFLVNKAALEPEVRKQCAQWQPLQDQGMRQDSVDLYCFQQFYRIEIDGQEQTPLSWNFHRSNLNSQQGLMLWLDAAYLERGPHRLKLWINHPFYEKPVADIPFFVLAQ